MKIFKHRCFQQWLKSESLTDEALKKAVDEIERGLNDGNLGSGLYKKRIAMVGKGKRGSYRTLLAFQQTEKTFFVYGFAKNMKANILPNIKNNNKNKLKKQISANAVCLSLILKVILKPLPFTAYVKK